MGQRERIHRPLPLLRPSALVVKLHDLRAELDARFQPCRRCSASPPQSLHPLRPETCRQRGRFFASLRTGIMTVTGNFCTGDVRRWRLGVCSTSCMQNSLDILFAPSLQNKERPGTRPRCFTTHESGPHAQRSFRTHDSIQRPATDSLQRALHFGPERVPHPMFETAG